jgi:hypothetical protein
LRCELLQDVARGAQIGAKLQRFPEIRNRAGLVAKPHLRLSAIIPGKHVRRIVLHGVIVIGEATLVVTLVEPDHATIAPAARIGRCQPDHFGIIGGGPVSCSESR